jgi:hypothetical protein
MKDIYAFPVFIQRHDICNMLRWKNTLSKVNTVLQTPIRDFVNVYGLDKGWFIFYQSIYVLENFGILFVAENLDYD